MHFKNPVYCHAAIDRIKNMLQLQPLPSNFEHHASTSHETEQINKKDSFDLWAYHSAIATSYIQRRTQPISQEVNIFRFLIILIKCTMVKELTICYIFRFMNIYKNQLFQ